MPTEVIVALLSCCGTLAGSFLGVMASAKLTQYRLQQVEEKVEKHNNYVERTFILEGQMQEVMHDIKDLKGYHKPN